MERAWPYVALGGALMASLAWGASQRIASAALTARVSALDVSQESAEREIRRMRERVDALEDQWHTIEVVRTAIDLSPPLAPEDPPVRPAPRPVNAAASASALPPLPAPSALLSINSIPPSRCYLDGRELGSTPQVRVSTSPGKHEVRFDSGSDSKTTWVEIAAGEAKTVTAKFQVRAKGADDGF